MTLSGFPSDVALVRDPAALIAFASDHERAGTAPLGLARPSSIEQLMSLIGWANRAGTSLVPFSSLNGPRRRGDTVSRAPHLMIDMTGFVRVIHVDGDNRIAVIEPGVTFGQFDAALAPHGLRSFKPLLPRAGKSVLACHLEREAITSAYDHWDTSDPLSALELVFGNGERFRTGGGAAPGSLEANLARGLRQMVSSGPIATDFTRVLQGAQGSLGVVGWGSVYCERVPPLERACFVTSDELAALVKLAQLTLHRRVAGQLFIVDRVQLRLMVHGAQAVSPLPADLPRWILYANLTAAPHFPEEHLAYVAADFAADTAQAGLAAPVASLGGLSATRLHHLLQTPVEGDYKQRPMADYTDFCLVSQLTKAQAMVAAVDGAQAQHGAGFHAGIYLQPMVQGVTCHMEVSFTHAPAARADALRLRAHAVQACAAQGAFFSRPYGEWGEVAFERDPQAAKSIANIKALLDPRGVMNPERFQYA
jgi:FAD/FMN-containing dehydrogenase